MDELTAFTHSLPKRTVVVTLLELNDFFDELVRILSHL